MFENTWSEYCGKYYFPRTASDKYLVDIHLSSKDGSSKTPFEIVYETQVQPDDEISSNLMLHSIHRQPRKGAGIPSPAGTGWEFDERETEGAGVETSTRTDGSSTRHDPRNIKFGKKDVKNTQSIDMFMLRKKTTLADSDMAIRD